MVPTTLGEHSIANALYRRFQNGWLAACPRFTARGWWEADLFAVTRARYSVEYEIKITRSDFKADAKKHKAVWPRPEPGGAWKRGKRTKHDDLGSGENGAPSRFYFVTPTGLLVGMMIPTWAGVIEVEQGGRVKIIREARRLHNRKVGPGVCDQMHRALSYRYWNQRAYQKR